MRFDSKEGQQSLANQQFTQLILLIWSRNKEQEESTYCYFWFKIILPRITLLLMQW
jgi:hypothetical protein